MSISGAVVAQFKLILIEKCSGPLGNKKYCLEAGWPELDARCIFHLFTALLGYILIAAVSCVFIVIFLILSCPWYRFRQAQLPTLFRILRCPSYPVKTRPLCLHVITTSNYVAYAVYRNFPLSTWGEGIALLIQHVITTNLFILYNSRHRNAVLFMFLYTAVMVILLWPLVPGYVLVALKLSTVPIAIFVKLSALYQGHKEQELRELSTKSSRFLLLFCCFGRLLTSVVDTRDLLMVGCYFVDCVLNTILIIQTMRYKRKKAKLLAADVDSPSIKQRGAG